MAQSDLSNAKKGNNNEFYTQYSDIEKEVNNYVAYDKDVFRDKTILLPCDDPEWSNFTKYFVANFNRFGLKKLISTSYAKGYANKQISIFELNSPQFDSNKHEKHGRKFVVERGDEILVDQSNLRWEYLDGDGDFMSDEVTALRDEADIIITNPPFNTLFRDFFSWIIESGKGFLIIAEINSITYKDVFPHIKAGKVWAGTGMGRWISGFIVPDNYELYGTEARLDADGHRIVATNKCLWYTNLEHGKRHEPLKLMTMSDNLKFNQSLKKKLKNKYGDDTCYPKYTNYDAIDVPLTEGIPSDYDGCMGVPVSFLDKFNPDQFEILGCSYSYGDPGEPWHKQGGKYGLDVNGTPVYKRLFIRHKQH